MANAIDKLAPVNGRLFITTKDGELYASTRENMQNWYEMADYMGENTKFGPFRYFMNDQLHFVRLGKHHVCDDESYPVIGMQEIVTAGGLLLGHVTHKDC